METVKTYSWSAFIIHDPKNLDVIPAIEDLRLVLKSERHRETDVRYTLCVSINDARRIRLENDIRKLLPSGSTVEWVGTVMEPTTVTTTL